MLINIVVYASLGLALATSGLYAYLDTQTELKQHRLKFGASLLSSRQCPCHQKLRQIKF